MNSLFHYTSLDTFQKMLTVTLSKENQSLLKKEYNSTNSIVVHFSHIRYMNDNLEYEFFKSILWKTIHKREPNITKKEYLKFVNTTQIFSEPFIFSLSAKKDFLPMWKMYSNNVTGVMIEFDKRILCSVPDRKYDIGKCLYTDIINDETYISRCIEYIRSMRVPVYDILRVSNLDFLKHMALHKSPDFSYEDEWRLFMRTNIALTKSSSDGIKLYTDVVLPVNSIKSVTLAPCVPQAKNQIEAITHLLATKGVVKKGLVKQSKIVGYHNT